MDTLKLNLQYGRTPEQIAKASNQELTQTYIETAMLRMFPQGLERIERRIYARLQEKIEAAVAKADDGILIEKAELDLLKKAILAKGLKLDATVSRRFVKLEDEIERLVDGNAK